MIRTTSVVQQLREQIQRAQVLLNWSEMTEGYGGVRIAIANLQSQIEETEAALEAELSKQPEISRVLLGATVGFVNASIELSKANIADTTEERARLLQVAKLLILECLDSLRHILLFVIGDDDPTPRGGPGRRHRYLDIIESINEKIDVHLALLSKVRVSTPNRGSDGKNLIVILGPAGCGKSFFLKMLVEKLSVEARVDRLLTTTDASEKSDLGEHSLALPRWARVAFAARCSRRVAGQDFDRFRNGTSGMLRLRVLRGPNTEQGASLTIPTDHYSQRVDACRDQEKCTYGVQPWAVRFAACKQRDMTGAPRLTDERDTACASVSRTGAIGLDRGSFDFFYGSDAATDWRGARSSRDNFGGFFVFALSGPWTAGTATSTGMIRNSDTDSPGRSGAEYGTEVFIMSKHVRLKPDSLEFLQRVARNRNRPQSETADQILNAFEDFLQEIERGSSLVFERPDGKQIRYASPILKKGLLAEAPSPDASDVRHRQEGAVLVHGNDPESAV